MYQNDHNEKLKHISATLEKLAFGSVVITVHDGVITQIDTTEKQRFTLPKKQSTK